LFPVVHFLKYVVTELVLFSVVAFKTLTFQQGTNVLLILAVK